MWQVSTGTPYQLQDWEREGQGLSGQAPQKQMTTHIRNGAMAHPLSSFTPDIAACLTAITKLRRRLNIAGYSDEADSIQSDGLTLVQALATTQVVRPVFKESLTTQL